MALLSSPKQQPKASKAPKLKKHGNKELAMDVQIAAGMACIALLSQQGIQALSQVLKGANDPVQALAHALFLSLSKVKATLAQRKIKVDDKIWIMGGGVLDRVIFEVMLVLATVVKFQPAATPQFVHQVKAAVLDLMEDDDSNGKAIKVLHDKGLPVPKGPPDAQEASEGEDQQAPQQGGPQGLVAPQQPQQQGNPQQMMGAQ